MAPMEFKELLESQVADQIVKSTIQHLLTRKIAGEELNVEPKIKVLNDYLQEKIEENTAYVSGIIKPAAPDTGLLNLLFKETMNEVWGTDLIR